VKKVSAQLAEIARLRGMDLLEMAQLTSIDLVETTTKRTPVDEGDLRGSWQPTIGSPATSDVENTDTSGGATVAKAVNVIKSMDDGDVFYYVSNKPYAVVAEYGLWGTGPYATTKTTRDGYSIQAPYGMVGVTVSEFQAKADKWIRHIKSKQKPVK